MAGKPFDTSKLSRRHAADGTSRGLHRADHYATKMYPSSVPKEHALLAGSALTGAVTQSDGAEEIVCNADI